MQRSLTVEDVLGWRIAGELSVGPGPRIAYTLREADLEESTYRTHLWSVTPGQAPIQLTQGEKGCSSGRWSPDGRYLAFLTSRPQGKPTEGAPLSQLWLLPGAGGEAFCLTRIPTGVRTYRWAPDGARLIVVADEPESDAEKARKGRERARKADVVVEHAERRRRQVWQVEVKPGGQSRLLFAGDFGLGEIALSPDGLELAYTTNYTGLWDDYAKYDLWVLNLASGVKRRLVHHLGSCRGIAWSPDGERIAYMGPHDPAYSYSRSELFVVAAAGGDPVNLCDRNPSFIGDIVEVAWEGPEQLLLVADVGCYSHIYRMHLATGALERLTPEAEVVTGIALSPDRGSVAYLAESAYRTPEVMWLDLQGGAPPIALTDLNPRIQSEIAWGEQRVIAWDGEGGLRIEGLLTLPPDYQPGRRYPLLVSVHGGPHAATLDRLRQYTNPQVLAARGYAVLAPNYRGGSGYGQAFAICNRADLGGADFRDLMAGVDHLIGIGIGDGDRLGIFGGSYGGYMTNWAIGQTDRFKAAVSMRGIFSLITDYSQSEIPSFELGYLGAYWWERPELYARASPSSYVTQMVTPVLIMHGDADSNTHPANSKEMYQALRHLGRTVEYVRYPREGHGVTEPNHKLDEYQRILGWFDRHIMGPDAHGEARGDSPLTVRAVEQVESYSGRKPKGRFLAVSLRIQGDRGVKLDLTHVRLLAEADGVRWEVGVAGVAVGLLLVPAGGPVEIGGQAALTLVFDLPETAPEGRWRLEMESFAPISIGDY